MREMFFGLMVHLLITRDAATFLYKNSFFVALFYTFHKCG